MFENKKCQILYFISVIFFNFLCPTKNTISVVNLNFDSWEKRKFCKGCKDYSGDYENLRPPIANRTDASLNSGPASNTANLGTVSRDMHVDHKHQLQGLSHKAAVADQPRLQHELVLRAVL